MPARLFRHHRRLLRVVRWLGFILAGFFGLCTVGLLYVKWLPPLTTSVQVQRRVESLFESGTYTKRYAFIPLTRISPHLAHAAVASEDTRFFDHSGVDWVELRAAATDAWEEGELRRGGSTITQQLVKNLFLTAYRSLARKGLEFVLAPVAELLLSKKRILELYLNVVEWGPGVYGAEAAARFYYRVPARNLTREQAARLVACLPSPQSRTPEEMDRRGLHILERMRGMGW